MHVPELKEHNEQVVVSIPEIYHEKNGEKVDFTPKVFDADTSDLRQCINKYFKYPEMCKEMRYEGKLYFEISRDSLQQFSQIKTLRGFDQSCTEMVLKEIKRILRTTPVIDVDAEINSFVLQMKVALK